MEVELCGHATLASAFVILNYYEPKSDTVVFYTLSGALTVRRIQKNTSYGCNGKGIRGTTTKSSSGA